MQFDLQILNYKYNATKLFRFALISDLHLESDGNDWEYLQKFLDNCKEQEIPVFINGDIADLILPGDKKRFQSGQHKTETAALLNRYTMMIAEKLMPYCNIIMHIGAGNHEDSSIKYNFYDLGHAVVTLLNAQRNPDLPPIYYGGYRGFIRLVFSHESGGAVQTFDIFKHHGAGGSAPVTKGMIDLQRIRAEFDASLYWIGHKHSSILDDNMKKTYVTTTGLIKTLRQNAVITGAWGSEPNGHDGTKLREPRFEDRFYNTPAKGGDLLELEVCSRSVSFHVIKNPFFLR